MKLVCSVLISALVIAFVQQSLQDDENAIPVVINRRLSGDIHYFNYPDIFSACSDRKSSNFTYLVEERLCVTSSDLQKECSSLIIPNDPSDLIAVASALSSTSTLVINASANGGATFRFKDTEQPINKSVCDIDSLEVYRGREQAIKISHNGFTLSNSGAFEINYDETTYSRDEYEGELYRINLSCSGEELPENGCLFFKVRGIANITKAKFNCTVPGTLTDFNKECKYTTTTNTISTTTSPSTTLSTTTNSLSPTSGFELGGTYFLIVVVCGVLAVALLIAIVLMCCMVCLLRRKRLSSVQAAPLGDESCKQQSNLQDLDTKLSSPRYHTAVPQEYETLFSNREMTGGEDHTYASLGDPKNPRHYTDPIKINPNKIKRHPNGSVPEKDRRASEPSAQYENPHSIQETSIKPQSREGHSDDVSEHKYAELERPPLTQSVPRQQQPLLQGGGSGGEEHHYDAPPIEDETSPRPHPSDKQRGDNDPANHVYAILENR